MTNSQMKKAIDETISNEPMMNEAFVQRVLNGKKKRKRPIPFLQPALVVVMMLVIGAMLYFTPSQTEQTAVEIKEYSLTDTQAKLVQSYYSAIAMKDEKALAKVATLSNAEVIERYEAFDLTKTLEVIKTIDAENELTLYMKLQGETYSYLEKLVLNKESEKIILSDAYEFLYYEEEIELPKSITLKYKAAPIVTPMEKSKLNVKKADQQTINGHTLYQIETKQGIRRIFESYSGERFNLGIASDGLSYLSSGHSNQFFVIDEITKQLTYIYLNQQGNYQMITGDLGAQGVMQYKTDFHAAPFLIMDGEEPKIMTIENDALVYADFFANAEIVQPLEFYSTERYGSSLLVKYTDDLRQISQSYELTSLNLYENLRLRDMLEAKPEHLKNMSLTNRYNDQLIYIFDDDTLHYRGRTNTFELVEKTYTNIQIETKDDQYFITGDDGFSWTLTRTAPRILQDEKGIEYTTPIKFEDLDKINDGLIDEEIKVLKLYRIGGTGTNAYILEQDLDEVNGLFKQAAVNKNFSNFDPPKFKVEVEYLNGQRRSFDLYLSEDGQASAMIKNELFSSVQGFFEIPEDLANHFRQLVKQIEEIDKST